MLVISKYVLSAIKLMADGYNSAQGQIIQNKLNSYYEKMLKIINIF